MYPNEIIFSLDLYTILSGFGILCSFLVFRLFVSSKKMPDKYFNFYLFIAIASVGIAYLSAGLFQSIFTLIKTGRMNFLHDGITFYGGLFGGVICFLILFVVLGKIIFKNTEYMQYFKQVLFIAPSCVTIAHAFGRLGCLFAGCCHGKVVESGGVYMYISEMRQFAYAIPIQLYESIFLFALFVVLTVLYVNNLHFEAEVYCIGYGVWRFFIEFLRGDNRGEFFIKFLSPSQGFAILFITLGICIITYKLIKFKKKTEINE